MIGRRLHCERHSDRKKCPPARQRLPATPCAAPEIGCAPLPPQVPCRGCSKGAKWRAQKFQTSDWPGGGNEGGILASRNLYRCARGPQRPRARPPRFGWPHPRHRYRAGGATKGPQSAHKHLRPLIGQVAETKAASWPQEICTGVPGAPSDPGTAPEISRRAPALQVPCRESSKGATGRTQAFLTDDWPGGGIGSVILTTRKAPPHARGPQRPRARPPRFAWPHPRHRYRAGGAPKGPQSPPKHFRPLIGQVADAKATSWPLKVAPVGRLLPGRFVVILSRHCWGAQWSWKHVYRQTGRLRAADTLVSHLAVGLREPFFCAPGH